jgi:hypothetical protein
VTEHLRDQGCLGPLLAWYYRSWIAPSDMDGSKSSGIPWGYLLSYGCLVLYTLVLTLRYCTTTTHRWPRSYITMHMYSMLCMLEQASELKLVLF